MLGDDLTTEENEAMRALENLNRFLGAAHPMRDEDGGMIYGKHIKAIVGLVSRLTIPSTARELERRVPVAPLPTAGVETPVERLPERVKEALDLIGDLSAGRKDWRMRIPACDDDPDILLSNLIRDLHRALAALPPLTAGTGPTEDWRKDVETVAEEFDEPVKFDEGPYTVSGGFINAARRLAVHLEEAHATIAELREKSHEAENMALSLEAMGAGRPGKLCTPLGRYRDKYPRAALAATTTTGGKE